MADESQEKHYKPSKKRLDELKKQGNFLRSKDLSSGLIIILAIFLLGFMADRWLMVLLANFQISFAMSGHVLSSPDDLNPLYARLAMDNLWMMLPLFGLLLASLAGIVFLFGGFGFSLSVVKFKAERINPLKNLQRIFSFNHVIETLKSTIKFILFFLLTAIFFYCYQVDLFELSRLSHQNLLPQSVDLIKQYFMMMGMGVTIVVGIDLFYSYHTYQKKNRMSFQDVKDENKETDGNPENKKRLRTAQMALSRQRVRFDVPTADVVITNPTHYAVALRYTEGMDQAPKVIAKGKGPLAAEIRLIAIKHAIPFYAAPPLARALYATSTIGDYIHEDLYRAVAIVLSYIYQLKKYQRGEAGVPTLAQDLTIPASMQFDSEAPL